MMDGSRPAAGVPNAEENYGVEVLCASWNPAAPAIVEPRNAGSGGGFLASASSDIENFLRQFYRCQSA